jgi:hypothetical protein
LFKKVAGVVVAAIMPFVAAAALLTPRPLTVSLPSDSDQPVVAPHVPPADSEQGDDLTDLSGNPVSDAVARYQFDATGSLYELHSPQTEVPHLRPPRT